MAAQQIKKRTGRGLAQFSAKPLPFQSALSRESRRTATATSTARARTTHKQRPARTGYQQMRPGYCTQARGPEPRTGLIRRPGASRPTAPERLSGWSHLAGHVQIVRGGKNLAGEARPPAIGMRLSPIGFRRICPEVTVGAGFCLLRPQHPPIGPLLRKRRRNHGQKSNADNRTCSNCRELAAKRLI